MPYFEIEETCPDSGLYRVVERDTHKVILADVTKERAELAASLATRQIKKID